MNSLFIPADVPKNYSAVYTDNYNLITRSTDRLFLFSYDQRLEHLHEDFYGPSIAPADNSPLHAFNIASKVSIGAFASHLGIIARYGKQFPTIPYIVKLNGKTNLVKAQQQDPLSLALWSVDQVIKFKEQSGLPIVGIGYTIYIGSEFESKMLEQAANAIFQAHQHGLITLIWAYPRGKAIQSSLTGQIVAGAANVALSLGADFVKLNMPTQEGAQALEWLARITETAGSTKVIVSGGPLQDEKSFLTSLADQLHKAGTAGIAVGRNLHQRPFQEAVSFAQAIISLIYEDEKPKRARV